METPGHHDHSPYVPEEAYLFFPKSEDPRSTNTQRTFFDGNTTFMPYEYDSIAEFRAYAQKQNYTLKPLWTDAMVLRFLYANNFKMNKTLPSVKEHTLWRESKLPVQVDDQLKKILNSDLLYVHGRDQEFRPIVVFNIHLLDPKTVDVDLITRALTYWFEHVINEWMLPGQVENWVFIADVKGMGVGTFLLANIRKLFGYLQDNYKCRLHRLYILNVTPILYTPWQIIKKFLDEVTVRKVQLCKGQLPVGLLDSTNPEQLEKRLGGTAPNATQFWPPVIASNNYFVTAKDSAALVSEDKYIDLYHSGSLNNMRVDHRRITRSLTTPTPIDDAYTDAIHPASLVDPISSLLGPEVNNPIFEDSENVDESLYVDYLENMGEMMEHMQLQAVTREFQSSFLGNNGIFSARNSIM